METHNHNWNTSNGGPVDFEPDPRSCWIFCWQTYNTSYFTWAKKDHAIQNWQTGCFCKKSYLNTTVDSGYVSGIVCPPNSISLSTNSTTTSCIIEQNIAYNGTSLNDIDDPRQSDAESCKLYCKSNYPNATHFGWKSPSSNWVVGRNSCWCKNSIYSKESRQNTFSGELYCGGNFPCICFANIYIYLIRQSLSLMPYLANLKSSSIALTEAFPLPFLS